VQFKISISVELKRGSQRSVDLASGTLDLMSAETQGTTVYRGSLACIDAGQIVGRTRRGSSSACAAGSTTSARRRGPARVVATPLPTSDRSR
jgi:hypothetical protein